MKTSRNLHPRPQCIRATWLSLDGIWDFCFDKENQGIIKEYYKGTQWGNNHSIKVPYVYQSPLSGIGIDEQISTVWYKKTINIPDDWFSQEIILHIEASDFKTEIYINGQFAGVYTGGYFPIDLNCTPFLIKGTNTIVIRVEDLNNPRFPMGKQSYTGKNFACWYTTCTGIWQSVWLEKRPKTYIKNFKFIPHLAEGELEILAEIEGSKEGKLHISIHNPNLPLEHCSVTFKREITTSFHNSIARCRINIADIGFEIPYWSPETPHLIDVTLTLEAGNDKDCILSYCGFREVKILGQQFYLNGRPYFQKLILNQGYYDKGLLTGTEEEFLHDIRLTKEMGFNGMRMHQKIESSRFMYHCDKEGLLFWAELPSPYSHDSFATVHILENIHSLVEKHMNHPCVVAWTPFNESWGVPMILSNKRQQQITRAAREVIHALDEQQRPVISNDGWEHTVSDILTIHDYEQNADAITNSYPLCIEDFNENFSPANVRRRLYAEGYHYRGEPILLSEYGGIAYIKDHYSNADWGYGNTAQSIEEFYERFEAIHDAYYKLPYLCGICYTQLTDVQQEVNGLLDHQHQPKFDTKKIANIINKKSTI